MACRRPFEPADARFLHFEKDGAWRMKDGLIWLQDDGPCEGTGHFGALRLSYPAQDALTLDRTRTRHVNFAALQWSISDSPGIYDGV
jgi:hypothetical protein